MRRRRVLIVKRLSRHAYFPRLDDIHESWG